MINMNLYSIIKIYGFKLNSDKKKLFVNIKIDLTLFISFSQNGMRERMDHTDSIVHLVQVCLTQLYTIMYLLFYFTIFGYFFGWHV